ncbi:MAG: 5'-nucleotidase C-terminal domain-containing protein [Bacteroidales bacterium]|nr:5'-nucleotidase C-terminal domain-containing protein [Bacteroidales bacterium]MDD7725504.1 5'-nucleotidase C-terminal domain-containing protein [Bacteroidales bacterium]MDY4174561.1 5'-nucleotidase C-terminal domain-containing protein [Bacteroidales bacterium]
MKKDILITLSVLAIVAAVSFAVISHYESAAPLSVNKVELCPIDSSIVPDAEIEETITVYRDSLKRLMGVPLCKSASMMVAYRPESSLGRYVADVVFAETKRYAEEHSLPVPEFGLMNIGGIRSFLHAGTITVGDIFCIAPFNNTLVVLSLDSADVMAMMDHVASRGGEGIANASMTIVGDKAKNVKICGKPLSGDKVYRLATIDYLSTGGDGFGCLVGKLEVETEETFRDALIGHLRACGEANIAISAPEDQRITVEN